MTGHAVLKRQPIQVPDIAVGPGYPSRVRDLTIKSGFRAVLAVPLIREDQVMGALTIARKQPGEFPQQVVDLMTTFASQSALGHAERAALPPARDREPAQVYVRREHVA